jgi:hypothetical protein
MSALTILRPSTFTELVQFGQFAAKSSMVPVSYKGKPEDVVLAVQMGSELGLAPMQALQNIAVINGRPALWGDAMLALCLQHPAWGGHSETIAGTGDAMTARCEVRRNGAAPVVATFGVEDAKRAGLWEKTGPWKTYPKRMLQMRARGFALRDAFPDALRGLVSAEEAQDSPSDAFPGVTIEATAAEEVAQDMPPDLPTIDNARTSREFLDAVRRAFDAAQSYDEAAAVASHPRVERAQGNDKMQPILADIINDALGRFQSEDGDFSS